MNKYVQNLSPWTQTRVTNQADANMSRLCDIPSSLKTSTNKVYEVLSAESMKPDAFKVFNNIKLSTI